MKKILCFLFLYCLGLFSAKVVSSDDIVQDKGTIVVTYQTDHDGSRLDRVRFWLINEERERTLYPKKEEFVSNYHTGIERTVVIGQLPAGHYTIQFLIPNTDGFFEKIPTPKEVNLKGGEVVKVDQIVKTHKISMKGDLAMLNLDPLNKDDLLGVITLPLPVPIYPTPSSQPYNVPLKFVNFSLKSNIPTQWNLMRHGHIIYSGVGSIENMAIPQADHYYIVAENVPGYTLYVAPRGLFDAIESSPIQAELFYQRDSGYVIIESNLAGSENFNVIFLPRNYSQPPIKREIIPEHSQIEWKSDPIPTGDYLVRYELPPGYVPHPEQFITISKSKPALLRPVFILKTVIQKKGPTTTENYPSTGEVKVSSNVESFKVQIKSVERKDEVLKQEIRGHNQSFNLPEGHYIITYEPINGSPSPSKPIEVNVRPFSVQTIYATFDKYPGKRGSSGEITIPLQSQQQLKGIVVQTNVPNSSLTIQESNNAKSQKVIHLSGKSTVIPIEKEGEYTLMFDPLPNSKTPNPVTITYKDGEKPVVEATYIQNDSFLQVPAGEAIVGDPFSDNRQNERPTKTVMIPLFEIAAYEVTNQQFANWLTKVFNEKKIFWHKEKPGHLVDQLGHLICKTIEGNHLSQIFFQKGTNEGFFDPVPGKENYPVIEVTWYGAIAYCQYYGYRLPSENEWEKAAGWAPSEGGKGSPKRYKYGFGQDVIDRSWANYRDPSHAAGFSNQVLTTPIGFYNGINVLPLTLEDRTALTTHDAKSPIGAYDMSGNVWEWVADENIVNKNKIMKGGCYDSLADGVRVSERLAAPADHSDIYTGFRVAK